MNRYILIIVLFSLFSMTAAAQVYETNIQWLPAVETQYSDQSTVKLLSFEGAVSHSDYGALPAFYHRFPAPEKYDGFGVEIILEDMVFEPLPESEWSARDLSLAGNEVFVQSGFRADKNISWLYLVPIRYNDLAQAWERVVSFNVVLKKGDRLPAATKLVKSFADNSVLANGNWYKVFVAESGMYQLSKSDLESLGIPVESIDPSTLKIYGNGAGIVPENTSDARIDDLGEIAIHVSGENDGSFDDADKITFYGTSPDKWSYNPLNTTFEVEKNIYSRKNCYFITYGGAEGKRITTREQSAEEPTNIVTTVDYYLNHELDEVNLIGSGREWYGEVFDVQDNYKLSFSIPNADVSEPASIYARLAARATSTSTFTVDINGESSSVSIRKISVSSYAGAYANVGTLTKTINPLNNALEFDLTYNRPNSSATGWLDRIRVQARRNLVFNGGQMHFCDRKSAFYGNISEFIISNANSSTRVYDVTDHQNVTLLDADLQGSELHYVAESGVLYYYLAVDGGYLTPELGSKVANQNLHAHEPVNMVIVTHPDFRSQADDLAAFHNNNGVSTRVVDLTKIYNEFSCGTQDPGGIRDYLRMLYQRSSASDGLKYLLLFGDASYDYLDRVPENENFVPTWESVESEDGIASYSSDDFYGFLDPGEGKFTAKDDIDLGIGRLVVTTAEQAEMAVNKIIDYATVDESNMGEWRNSITFVADDQDDNRHIIDADRLAKYVDTTVKSYNVNKIYIDAYPQVIASGGERYPQANEAINTTMSKGNLVVNYVGHGGEVGWALERILELSDINSWTNYHKMPLFITATCEFSRYDDPERVSAGEQVFLNPDGGGIALMTTSRATFAGNNYSLNHAIYRNMFVKTDGEYPRLGDILRAAKIAVGSDPNSQKYTLLGDPALRLAYPEVKVKTTHFNEEPLGAESDTIRALDYISISGEVTDENGNPMPDFNGIVYPTVYDKPSVITTLGNDYNSFPFDFDQRNRILYRGQAEVVDGIFTYSFHVPKDINYSYGKGKISYYVSDGFTDGAGFDEHFVIGGYSNAVQSDEEGPQINLFINDPFFANGGLTNSDPMVYAEIYDESGINVGTGIGHDLTATLDGNTDLIYVLNEFYQGKLNSYQHGTVTYPLFNLTEGKHTLELKVWDALNNSSTATVSFVVAGENDVILDKLLCYPNPFSNETQIFFEHNQSGQELDMSYLFFDLSGRLVYQRDVKEVASGYRTSPFSWDGTDNSGSNLPGGVYICKLFVTNEDDVSSVVTGKFVITR